MSLMNTKRPKLRRALVVLREITYLSLDINQSIRSQRLEMFRTPPFQLKKICLATNISIFRKNLSGHSTILLLEFRSLGR